MTIVIVGGGTGGHLFAAIALSEELKLRKYKVHLITDTRCKKYLSENKGAKYYIINSVQFKGVWYKKLAALSRISITVLKLLYLYFQIKPKVVFAFGGYPTFAPLVTSRLMRIPYILHEQNCFLGKVNSYFAKAASKITVAFPQIKNLSKEYRNKTVLAGNPVRKKIKNLSIKRDFTERPFKILVIGGSQGASIFNKLIPNALKLVKLKNPNFIAHIFHQAYKGEGPRLENFYKKLDISCEVKEFFFDMDVKYSESHLCICRAGAGTIAELIHTGLPSLLIPFYYATKNHQLLNAKMIKNRKACWYFPQNKVTPYQLAVKILELFSDPTTLQNVSQNLLKMKVNAEKVLADTVKKVLQ